MTDALDDDFDSYVSEILATARPGMTEGSAMVVSFDFAQFRTDVLLCTKQTAGVP